MDFTSIDFETANPNYASVCAIGWTTVRGGSIIDQGSRLCRPPAGYDQFGPYNVRVHGITADKVADQPTFAECVPALLARLDDGLPIIAHNAAFDINVLGQALATCGRSRPQAPHHCTMNWSKQLLQLPAYKLPVVCKHLGIPLDEHHKAGADALAAAQIALRLAELIGASTITELDAAANQR